MQLQDQEKLSALVISCQTMISLAQHTNMELPPGAGLGLAVLPAPRPLVCNRGAAGRFFGVKLASKNLLTQAASELLLWFRLKLCCLRARGVCFGSWSRAIMASVRAPVRRGLGPKISPW